MATERKRKGIVKVELPEFTRISNKLNAVRSVILV